MMDELQLRSDYDTIIVSYSTGIDSTGVLYWAVNNFDKERIVVIYNDTGFEYEVNIELLKRTCSILGITRYFVVKNEKDFWQILEERKMWPDSKNRWCTSYLKTDVTDRWIRRNRSWLGEKVLFLTGERRDESPRRSKYDELVYHRTHLKTERVGKFICHWYRPMLDFEKGKMFEYGKKLKLDPHPCYEYVTRCSCMACVFMPNKQTIENMKRHPEEAKKWIERELAINHTWKKSISLKELWDVNCEEVESDIIV